MVLKVPRLNSSPLALCDRPFSLLGFGDILVPGIFVSHVKNFTCCILILVYSACTSTSSGKFDLTTIKLINVYVYLLGGGFCTIHFFHKKLNALN